MIYPYFTKKYSACKSLSCSKHPEYLFYTVFLPLYLLMSFKTSAKTSVFGILGILLPSVLMVFFLLQSFLVLSFGFCRYLKN